MSADGRLTLNQLRAFSQAHAVTQATNSATTTFPGPVNVYQVQVDSPSANQTSIQLSDGVGGAAVKLAYLNGVGTREITWLGRPLRFANSLYVQRPDGDSHVVSLTVVYRLDPDVTA